jgi:hypothetical protein
VAGSSEVPAALASPSTRAGKRAASASTATVPFHAFSIEPGSVPDADRCNAPEKYLLPASLRAQWRAATCQRVQRGCLC